MSSHRLFSGSIRALSTLYARPSTSSAVPIPCLQYRTRTTATELVRSESDGAYREAGLNHGDDSASHDAVRKLALFHRRLVFADQSHSPHVLDLASRLGGVLLLEPADDKVEGRMSRRPSLLTAENVIKVLELVKVAMSRNHDASAKNRRYLQHGIHKLMGTISTMMRRSRLEARRRSPRMLIGDLVSWQEVRDSQVYQFIQNWRTARLTLRDQLATPDYNALLDSKRADGASDSRWVLSAAASGLRYRRGAKPADLAIVSPDSIRLDWEKVQQMAAEAGKALEVFTRGKENKFSENRLRDNSEKPEKVDVSANIRTAISNFERAWANLCASGPEPDHYMFEQALQLEGKLATWRSDDNRVGSDWDAVWQPIRIVMQKARDTIGLTTRMVNRILPVAAKEIGGLPDFKSSLDKAVDVYTIMRPAEVASRSVLRASGQVDTSVQDLIGVPLSSVEGIRADQATYNILIDALSYSGQSRRALAIYQDLQHSRAHGLATAPTLPTYTCLLRGFAVFGHPSELIDGDASRPSESTWKPLADDHHKDAWTIVNFKDLFEDFLHLQPQCPPKARIDRSKPIESMARVEPSGASENRAFAESSRSEPNPGKFASERAPSSKELFYILMALRKVSHDNVPWVLAQWDRIEAKFGPTASVMGRDGQPRSPVHDRRGRIVNKQGWSGWLLSPRLEYMIQWLRDGKPGTDANTLPESL